MRPDSDQHSSLGLNRGTSDARSLSSRSRPTRGKHAPQQQTRSHSNESQQECRVPLPYNYQSKAILLTQSSSLHSSVYGGYLRDYDYLKELVGYQLDCRRAEVESQPKQRRRRRSLSEKKEKLAVVTSARSTSF